MKYLIILLLLFPQEIFCQILDFISHKEVNLFATYTIEEEELAIYNIDKSKENISLRTDTTFGFFVFNHQEFGDSLLLIVDKKPKRIIGIEKFNWLISKDGAWNLFLDTYDSNILALTFYIEDQSYWIWEKELEMWEAPVEISIAYKELVQENEKTEILLKIKSFNYKKGEFKIPNDVYSELINIKNLVSTNEKQVVNHKVDTTFEDYFKNGLIKYKMNDIDGALIDLNKSIEINPNYSESFLYRGKIKGQLKLEKEALADLRKSVDLDPSLEEGYFLCGNTEATLGLYQDAIKDYKKAIQLNPKNYEAYTGTGIVKIRINDIEGAILEFNKAISIDTNYSDAYVYRGFARSLINDNINSIKDLDIAIKFAPNNYEAYFYRGIAKLSLYQYSDAISDLNKTIDLNSQNSDAYASRGLAFYKIGDIKNACSDWKTASKLGDEESQKLLSKYCK